MKRPRRRSIQLFIGVGRRWYQPAAAVVVVWRYALAALGVAYILAPCVAAGLDLQALRLAQTVLHRRRPCKTHVAIKQHFSRSYYHTLLKGVNKRTIDRGMGASSPVGKRATMATTATMRTIVLRVVAVTIPKLDLVLKICGNRWKR